MSSIRFQQTMILQKCLKKNTFHIFLIRVYKKLLKTYFFPKNQVEWNFFTPVDNFLTSARNSDYYYKTINAKPAEQKWNG